MDGQSAVGITLDKGSPWGGGKPNFIIVFVLSPTGKCELSYFELLET